MNRKLFNKARDDLIAAVEDVEGKRMSSAEAAIIKAILALATMLAASVEG